MVISNVHKTCTKLRHSKLLCPFIVSLHSSSLLSKFEICSESFTKVTYSNIQIEEKRCLPLFGLKNRQPYIQCCEALYESIFKTFMLKRISLKIQRDWDQPRPSSSNGLEMAASWNQGVKTSLQMSSKLHGQLDIVYIHVSKLFQNFVWMPCGFVLVQCILKRFSWSNFWSYTAYQLSSIMLIRLIKVSDLSPSQICIILWIRQQFQLHFLLLLFHKVKISLLNLKTSNYFWA